MSPTAAPTSSSAIDISLDSSQFYLKYQGVSTPPLSLPVLQPQPECPRSHSTCQDPHIPPGLSQISLPEVWSTWSKSASPTLCSPGPCDPPQRHLHTQPVGQPAVPVPAFLLHNLQLPVSVTHVSVFPQIPAQRCPISKSQQQSMEFTVNHVSWWK